jgi:hypothetical protein
MATTDNVIDIIYKKYPCVKEEFDKTDRILCTFRDACKLLYTNCSMWTNWLKTHENNESLREKYGPSIEKYGTILPDIMVYLSEFERIRSEMNNGRDMNNLSDERKGLLINLATVFGIKTSFLETVDEMKQRIQREEDEEDERFAAAEIKYEEDEKVRMAAFEEKMTVVDEENEEEDEEKKEDPDDLTRYENSVRPTRANPRGLPRHLLGASSSGSRASGRGSRAARGRAVRVRAKPKYRPKVRPKRKARRRGVPRQLVINRSPEQLINDIEEYKHTKHLRVSPLLMLKLDNHIANSFRDFLVDTITDTCFLSREQIGIDIEEKKFIAQMIGSNPLDGMQIGSSYMEDIIDANLAESFPRVYEIPVPKDEKKDSSEKKARNAALKIKQQERLKNGRVYKPQLRYDPTLWEDRPEFPDYAMICVLQNDIKENGQLNYNLTSFVSAQHGYDTIEGTKDRDVYGQLICTGPQDRKGGVAKALLVATILMSYQYKVNYVFIQAFQGVMGVQAPLYNRMGFHLKFSNDVLKRLTAFYQWTLSSSDEDKLRREHAEYLKGESKEYNFNWDYSSFMNYSAIKAKQLSVLAPMWIDIKGYDTSLACKCLTVSGYDYHRERKGPMGRTTKYIDTPIRLMYNYSKKEKPEIPITTKDRKPDESRCIKNKECLSGYCNSAGYCKPYDYSYKIPLPIDQREAPSLLQELDEYLEEKGLQTKEDVATMNKSIAKYRVEREKEGYKRIQQDLRLKHAEAVADFRAQEYKLVDMNKKLKDQAIAEEKMNKAETALIDEEIKKMNEIPDKHIPTADILKGLTKDQKQEVYEQADKNAAQEVWDTRIKLGKEYARDKALQQMKNKVKSLFFKPTPQPPIPPPPRPPLRKVTTFVKPMQEDEED